MLDWTASTLIQSAESAVMTSDSDQPASQPKKKKDASSTDHDSPWKEALDYYFQDFLELLFPEIAQAINWQHPPEFLDKELQKIVKQAPKAANMRINW